MDTYLKWKERLKNIARDGHKDYRQYDNFFDFWVLAQGKKVSSYKGGSRLCKGRIVLASPDLRSWYDPDLNYVCGVEVGALILIRQ